MKIILMLVSNAYRPDPRVQREAHSLADAGWTVKVLAWDRQSGHLGCAMDRNVEIERVQNIKTRYGAGWKQIFYTPRFWVEAIRRGLAIKPDFVHCHDLDTLYAGVVLKRKLNCRLIFDAHEDYPTQMSLYLPHVLLPILTALERMWVKHSDAILTASSVLCDQYRLKAYKNVKTIPNVQELTPFENISASQVREVRASLGIADSELAVGYIGGFSRNRELLKLIDAVKGMPGWKAFLWGDGHQRADVEDAVSQVPNAEYLGWLQPEDLPLYMKAMDVIYYCLRLDYPGAVYNAPNTLAHAMAAGRPIVANAIGDLNAIISKYHCGILLDSVQPHTISDALGKLENPALRAELGGAGEQAARESYNWGEVAKELIKTYEQLQRI